MGAGNEQDPVGFYDLYEEARMVAAGDVLSCLDCQVNQDKVSLE